jgi:hypothetical protein
VIACRHGPDELGPRVVVSVWSGGAAAGTPDRTAALDDLSASLDVTDARSERLVAADVTHFEVIGI